MKCQKPIKNKQTNQWEIWDFAYKEDGEKHYEVHKFYSHEEAIEYWKLLNPKLPNKPNNNA